MFISCVAGADNERRRPSAAAKPRLLPHPLSESMLAPSLTPRRTSTATLFCLEPRCMDGQAQHPWQRAAAEDGSMTRWLPPRPLPSGNLPAAWRLTRNASSRCVLQANRSRALEMSQPPGWRPARGAGSVVLGVVAEAQLGGRTHESGQLLHAMPSIRHQPTTCRHHVPAIGTRTSLRPQGRSHCCASFSLHTDINQWSEAQLLQRALLHRPCC
jgi:hypothetical protein